MVTKNSEEEGGRQGRASGQVVLSLVSLTLAKVQRMLTSAVKSSTWPKNRQTLTHAVDTHVPHHLRQELQNKVLQDWRLYDTISLRLLELILSPATSSLRLAHVRVFFRDAFLGLLHRLTGLQELTLKDSVWTLSRPQVSVMSDALSKMTNLRVLVLHYCGHNLLLAAAASHCPHLQVVSVRGSRAVDDSGVWSLVTAPTSRPAPAHHARKKSSIISSWYSVVKSLTSVTAAMEVCGKQKDVDSDEEFQNLPVYPDNTRTRTTSLPMSPCCASLTFVDLRCTSVTSAGVYLLTQALQPHAHLVYDTYHD
ncbi:uncharacterized protein LOC123506276 isoform X2 [Portunus trituberculatus]|uniref:uncharacterized protein LOC123506276 isoform X2 n=1 Tax=Portunus trituberculatus TaxID=210409 RepID=UPI001E1CB103|nr:uncharacterized protein LOC123506276 isoform X2 [Portunus trituberculatus]